MIELGKGYECELFFRDHDVVRVIHRGGLILWPTDLTSEERELIIDGIYTRYQAEYMLEKAI